MQGGELWSIAALNERLFLSRWTDAVHTCSLFEMQDIHSHFPSSHSAGLHGQIDLPTYEFLVIVVVLLSVFRIDLHGFVNEIDRFSGSWCRILVIAKRGLSGLTFLQLGEVLQRKLEQIPGLIPQHFHGKAL